jgi:hypothetical protein
MLTENDRKVDDHRQDVTRGLLPPRTPSFSDLEGEDSSESFALFCSVLRLVTQNYEPRGSRYFHKSMKIKV